MGGKGSKPQNTPDHASLEKSASVRGGGGGGGGGKSPQTSSITSTPLPLPGLPQGRNFPCRNPDKDERLFLTVGFPNLYVSNSRHELQATYPIKYLRGYGQQQDVFSFETGRKCPGGPQTYYFVVDGEADVFLALNEAVAAHNHGVGGDRYDHLPAFKQQSSFTSSGGPSTRRTERPPSMASQWSDGAGSSPSPGYEHAVAGGGAKARGSSGSTSPQPRSPTVRGGGSDNTYNTLHGGAGGAGQQTYSALQRGAAADTQEHYTSLDRERGRPAGGAQETYSALQRGAAGGGSSSSGGGDGGAGRAAGGGTYEFARASRMDVDEQDEFGFDGEGGGYASAAASTYDSMQQQQHTVTYDSVDGRAPQADAYSRMSGVGRAGSASAAGGHNGLRARPAPGQYSHLPGSGDAAAEGNYNMLNRNKPAPGGAPVYGSTDSGYDVMSSRAVYDSTR